MLCLRIDYLLSNLLFVVLVVLVQTQHLQMLQEELGPYFSLGLLKMDSRLPTSTFVYINTALPFGTFTIWYSFRMRSLSSSASMG